MWLSSQKLLAMKVRLIPFQSCLLNPSYHYKCAILHFHRSGVLLASCLKMRPDMLQGMSEDALVGATCLPAPAVGFPSGHVQSHTAKLLGL